jgi:hypothetical protein
MKLHPLEEQQQQQQVSVAESQKQQKQLQLGPQPQSSLLAGSSEWDVANTSSLDGSRDSRNFSNLGGGECAMRAL